MRLLFLVTLLFLFGCSTPYQKIGYLGGYDNRRLQKNVFNVSFKGNGYTSEKKVQKYLLRRCCDLTLQHGYDYFVILTGSSNAEQKEMRTRNPSAEYEEETTARYGYFDQNDYKTKGKMKYDPGDYVTVTKHSSKVLIECGKGERPGIVNAFDAKELIQYLEEW